MVWLGSYEPDEMVSHKDTCPVLEPQGSELESLFSTLDGAPKDDIMTVIALHSVFD